MNGLLLIDKPAGWTSHDVVAKIRGLARQATGQRVKVGHAGTLDPFATGLLLVLVGRYTKQADEFLKLDKTYRVTARLGETSSTGDPEGEITTVADKVPTLQEVKSVLQEYVGESLQTPPAYSALKVDGQRAYKLARAGQAVKLEPRTVTIYSLGDIKYNYPELTFKVKVSSGTYIRSLVEDIGQKLGIGAHTTALRRTEIGSFSLQNAVAVENLLPEQVMAGLN